MRYTSRGEHDIAPKEYQELKTKTIRIIQTLPGSYLRKDRTRAMVDALCA